MIFKGRCHCGAIGVGLVSDRPPAEQALGACQCSFCRKHNARAFSDPKARVTLTAADPEQLQRYSFGLRTSEPIVCRRCGGLCRDDFGRGEPGVERDQCRCPRRPGALHPDA